MGLLPFGIALVLLVGFSRLYSRSRFPHQIVASWLSGWFDFFFSAMVCLAFAIAVFMVNIFINIENNDSRVAWIPKEEYMRVILSIMGTSGEQGEGQQERGAFQNADDIFMDSADTPLLSTDVETPRGAAMRRAQMNASKFSDRLGPNGEWRQQAKRDSFHFLQRTLSRAQLRRRWKWWRCE